MLTQYQYLHKNGGEDLNLKYTLIDNFKRASAFSAPSLSRLWRAQRVMVKYDEIGLH